MTFMDIISETEAAQLAGVSARTLLRFSESGYLTVQLTLDGSRSYSRGQLLEIFGTPSATSTQSLEESTPTEPAGNEACSMVGTTLVADSGEHASPTPPEQTLRERQHTATAESTPLGELRPQDSGYYEEISRLKNLISMQERMLDSKDDEIADLRNQRAWLRERVEKLEEKSDRDQILLLSETQTIRQLIAVQESRKTIVQQVLEWIGVNKSSTVPAIPSNNDYSQKKSSGGSSRTIEVEKAANQ